MGGLGANHKETMTFDLDEDDEGTLTVTLSGELDMTNVETLADAVAPALERGPQRVVIDVREVRFADSSAIALWVQWASAVPDIELRDVSPLLRRVVESMGLSKTLNLTP